MKIEFLFSLATLVAFAVSAQTVTYTNLVVGPCGTPSGGTNSLTVRTGQVARVISANLGNGSVTLSINGKSFQYTTSSSSGWSSLYAPPGAPSVAGPATISLNCGPAPAFCTIELTNPTEPFTPSNAVVIPADSGGPVNIILESSTDLINWTPASPGSYGSSTEKRFFRVRAERTP